MYKYKVCNVNVYIANSVNQNLETIFYIAKVLRSQSDGTFFKNLEYYMSYVINPPIKKYVMIKTQNFQHNYALKTIIKMFCLVIS